MLSLAINQRANFSELRISGFVKYLYPLLSEYEMASKFEYGYFVSGSRLDELINKVGKIATEKAFDQPYNQTIYFNNAEYEVPFTSSIRARRYSKEGLFENTGLDEGLAWLMELKDESDNGATVREKTQKLANLGQIISELRDPTSLGFYSTRPLRPYAASSYKRRHFVLGDSLRVTVDSQTEYFLVNGNLRLNKIGHEDDTRVGLKFELTSTSKEELSKVSQLLKGFEAIRLVPKGDVAYNILSENLTRTRLKTPKSTDTHIVTRFNVARDEQQVIHRIKSDILRGIFGNFRLNAYFPATTQVTKLSNYIVDPKKETYICSAREDGNIVLKDSVETLKENADSSCVLKIKEEEQAQDEALFKMPKITLYQKTKSFFVENPANGNEYCVGLTRSKFKSDELYQLEIEWAKAFPTRSEQNYSLLDVSELARIVRARYHVEPTKDSSIAWLRKIRG